MIFMTVKQDKPVADNFYVVMKPDEVKGYGEHARKG